jgi:hypothetical protein
MKGEVDDSVHRQFVRFGKGNFENRAVLNLQKTSKIKLRSSFEYANDFVSLVSELGDFSFSGTIMSKEPLDLENEKKKSGLYNYEISGIQSSKVRESLNKVYVSLLNIDSEDLKLKMKKKLPKPGKSGEGKVDDKFCHLEADLKYWTQIKEFFQLPECKKCKISHTILVDDILLPQGENNPEKLRLNAKRKGKIVRKMEIDKQERKVEKEFSA